jgi:hypothetical protein
MPEAKSLTDPLLQFMQPGLLSTGIVVILPLLTLGG